MNHSYSQLHRDFQRIIDIALDQPLDADTQAALDQHLVGCAECRSYAANLKKLEERLGPVLKSRWPAAPLADGQRASILESILSHTRGIPMKTHLSRSVHIFASGTLAILLIIALGWGIRTLKPISPAGGGGTPPADAGRTPTASTEAMPYASTGDTLFVPTLTSTMETILLTPPPTLAVPTPSSPTSTPEATLSGSTGLFPKVQFTFATDFPAVPDQVDMYQQKFSEPITADLARQTAAKLGVTGKVVEYTGEGGETIYEVRGGGSVVRFLGYADQYLYEVMPHAGLNDPARMSSFEQQAGIAEVFLRDKGLLEGAYRVESVPSDPGVVRFVQLLGGRDVRYGVGENRMGSPLQWIDVNVTSEGVVGSVAYNAHSFQSAGQYPILSAQQAWERFSASPTGGYGMYAVLAAEQPVTYRTWLRDYPVGLAHIYDYAVSMQSAEGDAPLIQFGRYPVTGSMQGMEMGKFLHAWGQILLDEQGGKTFQVDGWELSTLGDSYLRGTIQRQGDAAILQTDDGQWLPLLDLPADVADGEQVSVRGVILNGVLDWSFIELGELPSYYGCYLSCSGGGGGGFEIPEANFGGVSLARLSLVGMSSAPAQPAPPYQAGDILDGLIGNVWVTLHQYSDRTEVEAALWVEADDGMIFVAYLSGPGLSGIEKYQALPIKVWGRVDRVDSSEMYFTVDRVEAAYPGERLQAWIGTEHAVTLEGKDALLFITLDGQQYVLKYSIGLGETTRIGVVGDTVIREGVIIPGLTFGNYQVIEERAGSLANGMTNLSGYTIMSSQPSVFDHTQDVPFVSPASLLQGRVSIEKIELVYLAYSIAGCPVDSAGYNPDMLYVQPAWRYTGLFEDGRRFEVVIQALPDMYLTFGMSGG